MAENSQRKGLFCTSTLLLSRVPRCRLYFPCGGICGGAHSIAFYTNGGSFSLSELHANNNLPPLGLNLSVSTDR